MVVYHLNYSLVRFILGASRDESVNVALMFVIVSPVGVAPTSVRTAV